MSYQVLARKWRPRTFEEVTGQSHVTTPLRNAVLRGRVPHALLLTGPRGVGKTTLARILARCLNCDDGPTDKPCGTCISCQEITNGLSTDVQEIDAASRTGVDDVRELIEAIRYAASPGKYRIYVVDEVHMLSTQAFNALLKTLEEPPPRSIFLFATTNPEKIPATVLSRCQRYDLRRIPTAEIALRLAEVLRGEEVNVSEKSLLAIARAGDGSLRDSMTLLDQILAFDSSTIDDAQVAQVLDLTDRRLLLAVAEACVDGDPVRALDACSKATSTGIEARRLGAELLQLFRDLTVLRVAPEKTDLVEGSDAEIVELRKIAERTEALRLRRMFRALLKEQEDLQWAPQPFAVLEMAAVRLATMAAGDDVTRLLNRIEALERSQRGTPPPRQPTGPGGGRSGPQGGGSSFAHSAPSSETPTPPSGPRAAADAAPALESNPQSAPLGVVFDRLKGYAMKTNRALFLPLEDSELLENRPGFIRIALPAGFGASRLEQRVAEFNNLCESFFGRPTQIAIEVRETPRKKVQAQQATPTRDEREALRVRKQNALEHPALNEAIEILGAEIVEIRVLDGKKT